MNEKRKIVKYAGSLSDLQVECIGENHDHSKALYFGRMSSIPRIYIEFYKREKLFVAIFEEDIPPKTKD